MTTAIVLFTRDLRVHDNPALAAATREATHVLPLFVFDDEILRTFGSPRRRAFMDESLDDLAASLGGLAVRQGDTVAETVRLARAVDARVVHLADDASAFAQRRARRLREVLEVRTHPSSSVVALDAVSTSAGGAYRVFSPYWRVWKSEPRRSLAKSARITLPDGVALEWPRPVRARSSWPGGETEGRRRVTRFLSRRLDGYRQAPDDLAADQTSQLSPYLHFGCVSPLELAERGSSNDAFVRQLCWRDFYLQLLAAHPTLPRENLRRRQDGSWRDDDEALDAWRRGETGYPIVDAAMRQLATEGWMHNRARLVVASFLTKQLGLDWRHGAEHFAAQLIDGDLASNSGNWQWVAGAGTNPRPNQTFNPVRQALRHDPTGDFVRRYVPELGHIPGAAVHTPWKLADGSSYPSPIVDPPGVGSAVRRSPSVEQRPSNNAVRPQP